MGFCSFRRLVNVACVVVGTAVACSVGGVCGVWLDFRPVVAVGRMARRLVWNCW